MIEITCKNCRQQIETSDNDAGRKVICPCCKNFTDVPGLLDLTFLPVSSEEQKSHEAKQFKKPGFSVIDDSLEIPFDEISPQKQYNEPNHFPEDLEEKGTTFSQSTQS